MALAPSNSGIPVMPAHSGPITALQFADRILAKAGPASPGSTDRIVAGDPLTPVTGIATTAIATMDTLAAAAKQGSNLVVSYDPTFWATGDQLDRLEGDPLFLRKRDFIREHKLVVLNLHDRWSGGIADGMHPDAPVVAVCDRYQRIETRRLDDDRPVIAGIVRIPLPHRRRPQRHAAVDLQLDARETEPIVAEVRNRANS